MSTIETIEKAVRGLTPSELAIFRRWFAEFDATAWDAQIEADTASGKLESLAQEALAVPQWNGARNLRHLASSRFWRCLDALPAEVQKVARGNFALLKHNPAHPSLQFLPVDHGKYRSVGVGLHYRALCITLDEGVQ